MQPKDAHTCCWHPNWLLARFNMVAPYLTYSLPEIFNLCLISISKEGAQMSIMVIALGYWSGNNKLCIPAQVFKVYYILVTLFKLILKRVNIRLGVFKARRCEYKFKRKLTEVWRGNRHTLPKNRLPKIFYTFCQLIDQLNVSGSKRLRKFGKRHTLFHLEQFKFLWAASSTFFRFKTITWGIALLILSIVHLIFIFLMSLNITRLETKLGLGLGANRIRLESLWRSLITIVVPLGALRIKLRLLHSITGSLICVILFILLLLRIWGTHSCFRLLLILILLASFPRLLNFYIASVSIVRVHVGFENFNAAVNADYSVRILRIH